MKKMHRHLFAGQLFFTFLAASSTWAVTIGQIDTFENGTTQGWIAGVAMGAPHPAPPANVLGGPAGATDHFLQLTSFGGNSPGARLSVLNLSQWAGNYITSGITSISMDLRNLGNTDLALRLAFEDPTGGPPSNVAFSKNAILLPASGGWVHAVFPIGLSDLQAGLGSVSTALMNTTAIRLYHSDIPNFPNPVFPIAPITARLGVDNIQAASATSTRVPENGSTAVLLVPALLTIGYLKRRATAS